MSESLGTGHMSFPSSNLKSPVASPSPGLSSCVPCDQHDEGGVSEERKASSDVRGPGERGRFDG